MVSARVTKIVVVATRVAGVVHVYLWCLAVCLVVLPDAGNNADSGRGLKSGDSGQRGRGTNEGGDDTMENPRRHRNIERRIEVI